MTKVVYIKHRKALRTWMTSKREELKNIYSLKMLKYLAKRKVYSETIWY